MILYKMYIIIFICELFCVTDTEIRDNKLNL